MLILEFILNKITSSTILNQEIIEEERILNIGPMPNRISLKTAPSSSLMLLARCLHVYADDLFMFCLVSKHYGDFFFYTTD